MDRSLLCMVVDSRLFPPISFLLTNTTQLQPEHDDLQNGREIACFVLSSATSMDISIFCYLSVIWNDCAFRCLRTVSYLSGR